MDDGRKAPSGRGAGLLEMMQKTKAQSTISSSSQSSSGPPSIPPPMPPVPAVPGRGRASLLDIQRSIQSPDESRSCSRAISSGRASLLGAMKRIQPPVGQSVPVPPRQQRSPPQVDPSGVLGEISELSVYDISSVSSQNVVAAPISRQGEKGDKINLSANYINLTLAPGRGMYQYEVKYSPDIDSRPLRRRLLNQHIQTLGRTKTFDGVLLYLPIQLPNPKVTLESQHPNDQSIVILTIIFKKKQVMSENVQFFNVLFGRVMRALQLVRIGRQNFSPKAAHPVPKHKLEVWPGYVTAVDDYEGGLKLCIDAKHRVMRTDTVRDLIGDVFNKNIEDYRAILATEIIGTSVLTRYNNKTYQIDDIAWDKNPMYEFEKGDTKISLFDYYQAHWNLVIKDKEQPLLIHRSKEKTSTGQTQERILLLVPELCYIAGLTDRIRTDFKVMKDLDVITKISPNGRRDIIRRFIKEVQTTEATRDILSEWGLSMAEDTVSFAGRTLPPEPILFGKGKQIRGSPNADWGRAAVSNPVLRTPNLGEWFIVYCQKDSKSVNDFKSMIGKISSAIGMVIQSPRMIAITDDRTETYIRELRKNINNRVELVVIVCTSNRSDRYAAIKKLCCVEIPVPSQVIVSRTISRADKLKSITEKIALQMNCKLGGALWALQIPFENCMICGIDVYHAGIGEGVRASVAGFVASLDKLATKWYSKVCMQGPHQELVDLLQVCLLSAIRAYFKENCKYPDRIIVYRDGVGDGQLDVVAKYEVKQLKATFSQINADYSPMFSVVVVQKRINTRIFAESRGNQLENPPPGTIVDSAVTRRNYYDFFLISQHVRQGTVTPTHYIVIYDGSKISPDHMQRLTYKLCHLYYNWPGTIRVPAPCQYAHKLVYLVGQSVHAEPSNELSHNLYYL